MIGQLILEVFLGVQLRKNKRLRWAFWGVWAAVLLTALVLAAK